MATNPDYARRLRWLLGDLGYDPEDGPPALARAAAVIARRTGRPFGASRLENLLKHRARWTADDVVAIATGLGCDVREILFEEGEVPRSRRRPDNPMDELELL